MSQLPLQAACNPNDEVEHVLWALVGLAGPSAHAPLVLPVEVLRKWAKHLYDCGFRHDPTLQKIKYIPPARDTNWVLGAAGKWVPIDQPLTPEQSAPDISHLTNDEKAVLFAALAAELNDPHEGPDQDMAGVTNG